MTTPMFHRCAQSLMQIKGVQAVNQGYQNGSPTLDVYVDRPTHSIPSSFDVHGTHLKTRIINLSASEDTQRDHELTQLSQAHWVLDAYMDQLLDIPGVNGVGLGWEKKSPVINVYLDDETSQHSIPTLLVHQDVSVWVQTQINMTLDRDVQI